MVHPQIGWTIRQLHEHLLNATRYVAITGAVDVGKSRLADQLATRCDARRIEAPRRQCLPPAVDLSGPTLPREIEWLQRVEPLLRRAGWQDPSRMAVSDFWLEQALAYGSVALANRERRARSKHDRADAWSDLLAAWSRTRLQAVEPQLLVLLDPPSHAQDPVRQSLVLRCDQPGLGPVLRLTNADPQLNFAEAAAAIAAMR